MKSEDESIDVSNFNSLENGTKRSKLSNELKRIEGLDGWMKSLPIKKAGANFTSLVMASARLAQKRDANFKFLAWVMMIFASLIVGSFWLLEGVTLDIQQLNYVSDRMDLLSKPFVNITKFLTSAKTRQLFLVIEGVLFLVVIEKLVSSFQAIKKEVKRTLQ